jgi:hypothetical protein
MQYEQEAVCFICPLCTYQWMLFVDVDILFSQSLSLMCFIPNPFCFTIHNLTATICNSP